MTQQLLMIEDDVRLATMVGEYLRQSGYGFVHAADAATGLQAVQTNSPDLVILDLMLPDMDGLEVCRRIKSQGSGGERTAVLMLTAKGDPMERIVGLEIGADDYLPKPFEPRELLARIRAVLRRGIEIAGLGMNMGHASNNNNAQATQPRLMRFGSLEIDRDARKVTVSGKVCDLTSYQFDLLVTLSDRAGRVLSRDQIMEAVRGRELEAYDRSIDVHMGRIRSMIEDDPKDPRRILTVRGVGYVFARQQD